MPNAAGSRRRANHSVAAFRTSSAAWVTPDTILRSSCASTGSGETIRNDHALPLAAPARSQPNRDLGAVGSPKMSVAPLQFLLLVFAGWVNRRQLEIVEFLQEENRVLRQQLGGRRLRFTDAQRRRLAAKGKSLGRRVPDQLGGLGDARHDPALVLCQHRIG